MPGADEQCLSVVMPWYNEALTRKTVVERVLESPYARELKIVDDGSTDGSVGVAKSIGDSRVRVLTPPTNSLYRGFDARIGHHRRYRRSELVNRMTAAGLRRRESRRPPRFDQSLFCVARKG